MPFAFFAFGFNSIYALILGVILWGIGMGAQESILKAAVAKLMPKAHRSMGFGLFELVFGVAWFMGSWFLGYLYDTQIEWMIAVSVGAQLLALPFFYFAYQKTIK